MSPEIPEGYKFINRPQADRPYVYDVSGDYKNTQEAWELGHETTEYPQTTVTFFPERNGVKMMAPDNPSYSDGKRRAIFGVAAMLVMLSGENVMKEL